MRPEAPKGELTSRTSSVCYACRDLPAQVRDSVRKREVLQGAVHLARVWDKVDYLDRYMHESDLPSGTLSAADAQINETVFLLAIRAFPQYATAVRSNRPADMERLLVTVGSLREQSDRLANILHVDVPEVPPAPPRAATTSQSGHWHEICVGTDSGRLGHLEQSIVYLHIDAHRCECCRYMMFVELRPACRRLVNKSALAGILESLWELDDEHVALHTYKNREEMHREFEDLALFVLDDAAPKSIRAISSQRTEDMKSSLQAINDLYDRAARIRLKMKPQLFSPCFLVDPDDGSVMRPWN